MGGFSGFKFGKSILNNPNCLLGLINFLHVHAFFGNCRFEFPILNLFTNSLQIPESSSKDEENEGKELITEAH